MAVRVDRTDGMDGYNVYENSTKWVIDEHQQLHIVGANGNIASYGRGAWGLAYLLSPAELKRERELCGVEAPA